MWLLPLSENSKRWLDYLVAWYDTSIDWASPGDSDDRWSTEELARFHQAASRGLALVREELGGRFEITQRDFGQRVYVED